MDIREEVLTKVGRNVVCFQKMEAMLKFLNSLQSMNGSAEDPQNDAEAGNRRRRQQNRKPMGPLADEFLRSAYSPSQTEPATPATHDIKVSTSFRIEADAVLVAERKKALRSVVRERNQLIHKWLAAFDPNSDESCAALVTALDEQYDRILPEFGALRALLSTIREHVDYLQSADFSRALRQQIEGK